MRIEERMGKYEEKQTTATVTVSGLMRASTSTNSSVWIRRPSNAPGCDRVLCAASERYAGWHLHNINIVNYKDLQTI